MNTLFLRIVLFQISGFIFHLSASAASLHTVLILHHRFEPESVYVAPGDTVRWLHQDAAAHTVTGTGTEIFDSDYMAWGDVYMRVFLNQGEHDYICLYHPMFGKVVVGGPVSVTAGAVERSVDAKAPGVSDLVRDALGRRVDPAAAPNQSPTPRFTPQ